MSWLPPYPGDGHAWMDGECMLYCRMAGRVLAVGFVKTPAGEGRMYACGECLHELACLAMKEIQAQDWADLAAR
ncbi:hypothetical protein QQM39_35740 [Streptomyces sp. DT2A-34]|uniref:hypothetical protein n=1 Tax=Streptomyces sp. DT2A-34 TaxID=3051182 RepID=UPI00265C7809|nr:hypothetical protein [Streptomyces sp. DT2A-34]MDO0915991.1 hypothetical protein [Streptomyces sp. DT2A-34]